MNALIIASSPISHIIPIKPLVKELISKKIKVYCISVRKNKERIESYGAEFIEYPFIIQPASTNKYSIKKLMAEVNQMWEEGKILEGYEYYNKKDIESLFDITKEQIDFMNNIALEKNIHIIFRDAVDKLGRFVAKNLNILCIGYMTHNIYSKIFFEQNPRYYYGIFMHALYKGKYLPTDYFDDFRSKCEKLFDYYSKKDGNYPVYCHHQLDPMTDFTIIFTTPFIQPKESLYEKRKYLIVPPDIERFNIEIYVDEKLKTFVESFDKIIYIASGSIVTQSYDYYKKFILEFSKYNVGVVISCGEMKKALQKFLESLPIRINNVYLCEFAPQQFLLSRCSLFISSCGMNSILEAIYHEVPMLATPMTSEMRLNGLIVDRINIGRTIYSYKNKDNKLGILLNELFYSQNIKSNLHRYSNYLKQATPNWEPMWDYIKENIDEKDILF